MHSQVGWWSLRKLTNQVQNQYSKIQISQLSRLPVGKPTVSQQRAIEERVEKILAAKKKNTSADTTKLEKEIDEIVYEIYGLTEEEKTIVEGNSRT